jgi:hypothetical protein
MTWNRLRQKVNVMKIYGDLCFGPEETEAERSEETYMFSGKY